MPPEPGCGSRSRTPTGAGRDRVSRTGPMSRVSGWSSWMPWRPSGGCARPKQARRYGLNWTPGRDPRREPEPTARIAWRCRTRWRITRSIRPACLRGRARSILARAGLDEAGLVGEDDDLDPVPQGELGQDPPDV